MGDQARLENSTITKPRTLAWRPHPGRAIRRFALLAALMAACHPPAGPREPAAASAPPPTTRALADCPFAAPPDGPRSFRLAVISDTNSRYGSVELAQRGIPEALASLRGGIRPAIVVHNGDMIAVGGRRDYPLDLVHEMWSTFHVTVTDVLRSARTAK
jgi:hypothetical protein